MRIELNGEVEQLPESLSVLALLERLDLRGKRVAVAVNAQVVPRSGFESLKIREGDRVEVIQAVGGG